MIYASLFSLIWFGYLTIHVKCKRPNYLLNNHNRHSSNENSDYCTNRNCKSPNVRTVLFKHSQVYNLCWNVEEVALLLTRAIMQDILPRTMPQNIPLLLDYFKDCLATIRKEVKNHHIQILMITAVVDTLGGYLQAFGLPIMKRIYYEGNLDFETINEFYELQNNFRTILSTDGGGWPKPMLIKHKITTVIPLKILYDNDKSDCQDVITIYDYSGKESGCMNDSIGTDLLIPMPVLDDVKNPHVIGVPLRGNSLYNLESSNAYDVLLSYYTISIQCINSLSNENDLYNNTEQDKNITYFEYVFFNWIMRSVIPRLNDEKWYPGFSSIFRILATMKGKGIPVNNYKKFRILKDLQQIEPNSFKRDNSSCNINIRYNVPILAASCTFCFILSTLCLAVYFKKKHVKSEFTNFLDISSYGTTSYASYSHSTTVSMTDYETTLERESSSKTDKGY